MNKQEAKRWYKQSLIREAAELVNSENLDPLCALDMAAESHKYDATNTMGHRKYRYYTGIAQSTAEKWAMEAKRYASEINKEA